MTIFLSYSRCCPSCSKTCRRIGRRRCPGWLTRTSAGRQSTVKPPTGWSQARESAVRRMTESYTSVSIALARTPPEASWTFRFYRGDDLVARTEVSVDGSKILG